MLFNGNKTRKVENRNMTEYFSTETINLNKSIIKNTHNIQPAKFNLKFHRNKYKLKSGTSNGNRKK